MGAIGLLIFLVAVVECFVHFYVGTVHQEIRTRVGTSLTKTPGPWVLTTRLWLLFAIAGFALLASLHQRIGPAALLVGGLFAALPVPFHVALIHWLARMEPEPPKLILASFLWGATVAVLVSLLLNELSLSIAASLFGKPATAESFVRIFVAPLVEETSKGIALLVLFFRRKEEFEDIVDGLLYAAMVGLGFAMSENIMYLGPSLLKGGGAGGVLTMVGMRGILSPYAHPLFTAMTGIGLGIAAQSNQKSLRFAAPIMGFLLAIFLHALWNLGSSLGNGFFAVYFLIMVPVFILVITLFRLSLRDEEQLLREHLQPDLREGRLTPLEFEEICNFSKRMQGGWHSLTQGGFKLWLARRKLQLVAKELGFHRHWSLARNQNDPSSQQSEPRYLALLQETRSACASLEPIPPEKPPVIPLLPG